ncbi:MAG: hypothetical protein WBB28_16335 [Crinalium sp.]
MYAKTTTLFTTTILSLVFYGLFTSPVLANSSQGSLQRIPSNYRDTEVGLPETETLIALDPGKDISQTQTVTPASLNQNVPGIISSSNGTTVQIKLADGTSQNYQLNPNLVNSSNIRRGAFVALLVDENKVVQEVQPAEVEKTLEGVVREVVGSQVTLELPNGQLETTAVAPAVSARMGLAPGVPLIVTSYRGIGSTKLCFGKTTPPPVSITPPPVMPNPPVGGGEPPAIKPPTPIPALW